jgi:hypothetical protein
LSSLPARETLPTWINKDERTLYFIRRTDSELPYLKLSSLGDTRWDLFVVYYHAASRLLFINSSDTDHRHQALANIVSDGTAEVLDSNIIFRCLSGIKRLIYQSVGLKRHGSRSLSFSNFQGTDVGSGLSDAQKALATKSYMSGTGFSEGFPISIGCSGKAKIWTGGSKVNIKQLIQWCDNLELKLSDGSINTDRLLENVLIPRLIEALPDQEVLCVDWAKELWQTRGYADVEFQFDKDFRSIDEFSIEFASIDRDAGQISFDVIHAENVTRYTLELKKPGYRIFHQAGLKMIVKSGKFEGPMEEWFSQWPVNVVFMDSSELNGAEFVQLQNRGAIGFPLSQMSVLDWAGTDIMKESMWKDKSLRVDSIQYKISKIVQADFDIVFDDDDAGEAADLVCIKIYSDKVRLQLIHCKFTTSPTAGARVKDVVEVCSQAIRSSRWKWRFDKLCAHLIKRETSVLNGRPSRFSKGDARDLRTIALDSKNKLVEVEIVIVQPGLSIKALTPDQAIILASTRSFLSDTVQSELVVVCSS